MKSIVIIGYGQLGAEVCQQHLKSSDQVHTLRRSHTDPLNTSHIPLKADLGSLSAPLALPDTIDCLYYFAPPSSTDLNDHYLRQFLSFHQYQNIRHIIYISTSGVYGDSKGEWVTEETLTNPSADRAKRRLNAEQQLIAFNEAHAIPITILRCAAIYSSQTVNRERILSNTKPVIKAAQAPFTNRIHLSDLTQVCLAAMQKPSHSVDIYNVSDGHPSTTTEHSWLLSDLIESKRNREIDLSEANQYYSSAYMGYLNESKKLDISKLKLKLKPFLKYEDICNGIEQCLGNTAS